MKILLYKLVLSLIHISAEKQLGVTSAFMGLIGITEGAIPFAVKDIKHALPPMIAGSTCLISLTAHGIAPSVIPISQMCIRDRHLPTVYLNHSR